METATLFIAAFANQIPHGALLLVSDMPLTEDGIKTDISDIAVTQRFAKLHLKIGIESLRELMSSGISVKHLIFEDSTKKKRSVPVPKSSSGPSARCARIDSRATRRV